MGGQGPVKYAKYIHPDGAGVKPRRAFILPEFLASPVWGGLGSFHIYGNKEIMSKILTGAVIGGAFNAAAAYMVSPVFAPGALLWAGNLGMVMGGLFGAGVACIHAAGSHRDYDTRHAAAMGAALSIVAGLFASAFALISAFSTNDDVVYDALDKAVTEIYGDEFKGAREGRTVPLRPALLGADNALPMIATFANDPQASLHTGSSVLNVRICAKFNVAYAATPGEKAYEYEICRMRPLTNDEIGRIIPSIR